MYGCTVCCLGGCSGFQLMFLTGVLTVTEVGRFRSRIEDSFFERVEIL